MTPERKHELSKLLAEVVGKTVHESRIKFVEPVEREEPAWVDDDHVLWDPQRRRGGGGGGEGRGCMH